MARNWLIVVVGLAFGLFVGVFAPTFDIGPTSNDLTTASGVHDTSQ